MPEETAEKNSSVSVWVFAVGWAACTLALFPIFFSADWAGSEVAKYQVTTFEAASRDALTRKDFDAALKYCNGAIKAGHGTSDHWGRVYTLRSVAYLGQGDIKNAAEEVLRAGDFFTRRYYVAEEQDRREIPQLASAIGKRLLQDNDVLLSYAVLSAGAMASGKPVSALYALADGLTASERKALWGDGQPRIAITSFRDAKENLPRATVNEQGRTLGFGVDPAENIATVDAGPSQKDGPCWLSVPTHVPIEPRAFALRIRAKHTNLPEASLVTGYWFESPRKSANTTDAAARTNPEGWAVYDIGRDFYAERAVAAKAEGYSPEDGVINQLTLSLPPGAADTIALAPAELYIPKG